MSAKILQRFANPSGWSTGTQIALLLEYIDRRDDAAAFATFLKGKACSVGGAPECEAHLDSPHALESRVDVIGTDNNGGLTVNVWCADCGAMGETVIPLVDVQWGEDGEMAETDSATTDQCRPESMETQAFLAWLEAELERRTQSAIRPVSRPQMALRGLLALARVAIESLKP